MRSIAPENRRLALDAFALVLRGVSVAEAAKATGQAPTVFRDRLWSLVRDGLRRARAQDAARIRTRGLEDLRARRRFWERQIARLRLEWFPNEEGKNDEPRAILPADTR